MSLIYDSTALRANIEKTFAKLAQTHPDPNTDGLEQTIVAAKVHEYTSLAEAQVDNTQQEHDIKPRVVLVSWLKRKDQPQPSFFVRKGRENSDGVVQIGRTWGLETLSSIDVPNNTSRVLILRFKKPYFWVFGSLQQRQEFETATREMYRRTQIQTHSQSLPRPIQSQPIHSEQIRSGNQQFNIEQRQADARQFENRGENDSLVNQRQQQQWDQQQHEAARKQELQRQEIQRQELQRQELQRQELQRQELQRQELQRQELQRQELQRQELRRQEIQAQEQQRNAGINFNQSPPVPAPSRSRTIARPRQDSHGQSVSKDQIPPSFGVADRNDSPPVPPAHAGRASMQNRSQAEVPAQYIGEVEPLAPLKPNRGEIKIPTRAPSRSIRKPEDTVPHVTRRGDPGLQPSPSFQTTGNTETLHKSPLSRNENSLQSPIQLQHEQKHIKSPLGAKMSPITSPEKPSPKKLHQRPLSDTPLASRAGDIQNLYSAMEEFKFDGLNLNDLEKNIKRRLDELNDQTFGNVVEIDQNLKGINALVKQSIETCTLNDGKMQDVAMNLISKNEDRESVQENDEEQVTALKYKQLAQEIEKILNISRLDNNFVEQFSNMQFKDPRSSGALVQLKDVEGMLVDLTQALEMFNYRAEITNKGDSLTMQAFLEPKRTAENLAAQFGVNFQRFISGLIHQILSNPPSMSVPLNKGLEALLLQHLSNYSGCVIFTKENVPQVYEQLLVSYENQVRQIYQTEMNQYTHKWCSELTAILGLQSSAEKTAPRDSANIKSVLSPSALAQMQQHHIDLCDHLVGHIAGQQFFLERFFCLGNDSATQFKQFVTKEPLPDKRINITEQILKSLDSKSFPTIGSSKVASWQLLQKMQTKIFPNLSEQINLSIVSCLTGKFQLETVYLVMLLDLRSQELAQTNQQFMSSVLDKLRKRLSEEIEKISKERTRSILSSHFVTKKRVGVHPVIARFTQNVTIIESNLNAALEQRRGSYMGDTTRALLDQSYDNMFRALAQGLKMGTDPVAQTTHSHSTTAIMTSALGGTSANEETKELLNRHVVMIENLYRLFTDLESVNRNSKFSSQGLTVIVADAKRNHKRELDAYIAEVCSRPLHKVMAFLNTHEGNLGPTSPGASKHKESISSLKRAVKGLDSKELRGGVEHLRKRVEKHFVASDKAVLSSVWHGIRDEYLSLYTRLMRTAQNLDASNYVEITRNDILSVF